jgi:hypothetical protein
MKSNEINDLRALPSTRAPSGVKNADALPLRARLRDDVLRGADPVDCHRTSSAPTRY